jgi:hypothetical protein
MPQVLIYDLSCHSNKWLNKYSLSLKNILMRGLGSQTSWRDLLSSSQRFGAPRHMGSTTDGLRTVHRPTDP